MTEAPQATVDDGVGAGDPYCTVAEALEAGAAGTEPVVETAVAAATTLVDLVTGVYFTPRPAVRRVTWGHGGLVVDPRMPVDLDTVEWLWIRYRGVGVISATSLQWWDQAAGGVRYAGGGPYEGVAAGTGLARGTFGYSVPPAAVRRATARLAAMYAPAPFAPGVDAEGNAVVRTGLPPVDDLTDPRPPVGRRLRTTGDHVADGLLAPWLATVSVS